MRSENIFMEIIKRYKKFILVGILIFITGWIAGYLIFLNNPDMALRESSLFSGIEKKFTFFENLSTPGRVIFLFLNNMLVAVLSIFLGSILGLFPIIAAFINGFTVGVISGSIIETEGAGYLLAGLVPHGIFELPAIFISIGMGLKLGYLILSTIISILLGRSTKDEEFRIFLRDMKPAFKLIIVLLAIGAIIEVLITPLCIKIAGG